MSVVVSPLFTNNSVLSPTSSSKTSPHTFIKKSSSLILSVGFAKIYERSLYALILDKIEYKSETDHIKKKIHLHMTENFNIHFSEASDTSDTRVVSFFILPTFDMLDCISSSFSLVAAVSFESCFFFFLEDRCFNAYPLIF